ncbi:hypothetical protein VNO78_15501 [Psophocarpus tetragonolobus]|uniref:Uncharacterized protein n=1 Tax=Psophocarpus tetragonolobus TaxID=3891 RepID=A0AAN9SGL1_PSOTE
MKRILFSQFLPIFCLSKMLKFSSFFGLLNFVHLLNVLLDFSSPVRRLIQGYIIFISLNHTFPSVNEWHFLNFSSYCNFMVSSCWDKLCVIHVG